MARGITTTSPMKSAFAAAVFLISAQFPQPLRPRQASRREGKTRIVIPPPMETQLIATGTDDQPRSRARCGASAGSPRSTEVAVGSASDDRWGPDRRRQPDDAPPGCRHHLSPAARLRPAGNYHSRRTTGRLSGPRRHAGALQLQCRGRPHRDSLPQFAARSERGYWRFRAQLTQHGHNNPAALNSAAKVARGITSVRGLLLRDTAP